MGYTDKYELEEVAYGVTGWNAILTANMQKIDNAVHTCLLVTLGEAASQHEPVYLASDGKAWRARADQARQPAIGLCAESGGAGDTIRVQRVGPVTNAAWSWTPGRPVYLSPDAAGALRHGAPAAGVQFMGIPVSATCLVLSGAIGPDALATTTTTTSTTTSTTSTTTT